MALARLQAQPAPVTTSRDERARRRRCIEIAVEKLIAALDDMDGDPDLEDDVWEIDADFEPAVA